MFSVRASIRAKLSARQQFLLLFAAVLVAGTASAVDAGPLPNAVIGETVSVPNGGGGNLVFASAPSGTGGWWSAQAPSRLTVPVGVRYVRVGAWAEMPAGCSVCVVYILKNDSTQVAQSYGGSANTGFGSARFNAIAPVFPVTAGDYFTVRVYQNTGAAITAPVGFSVMALDSDPVPSGSPFKTAYLSESSVSVANGWAGNLTFTGPSTWDTGGFWSSSQPTRLTVPANVSYVQVAASVSFQYQCTVCQVFVMKNDSQLVAQSHASTANTGFGSAAFSAIAALVPVSAGDYFTVRVYQNTGATVSAPVVFSIHALDGAARASGSTFKAASITQASSVSVANGWSSDLVFGGSAFDTAQYWSASQPTKLTVPAGTSYVQVSASVAFDYTCTVCEIYILKNDSAIVAKSYGTTANSGFGGTRFTAIAPVVSVAPGDVFTVRTYQNTGATVTVPIEFSIAALDIPSVVSADSVTPNTGSGNSQTFTLTSPTHSAEPTSPRPGRGSMHPLAGPAQAAVSSITCNRRTRFGC